MKLLALPSNATTSAPVIVPQSWHAIPLHNTPVTIAGAQCHLPPNTLPCRTFLLIAAATNPGLKHELGPPGHEPSVRARRSRYGRPMQGAARPTGSQAMRDLTGRPLPGMASILGFKAAVATDVRRACHAYIILSAQQNTLNVLPGWAAVNGDQVSLYVHIPARILFVLKMTCSNRSFHWKLIVQTREARKWSPTRIASSAKTQCVPRLGPLDHEHGTANHYVLLMMHT